MLSDRLGTARIQTCVEVREQHPYEPGAFWIGRTEDQNPIGYRDDRHICVVSGTRGGKGTSVIVNNLCFWPGSAVVVDPKGENATVTAARRGQGDDYCEGMGQTVHVLDPFNAATVDDDYRSTFNPLAGLDIEDEETIEEAHRIANAIIMVRENSNDASWDEQARTLVRGVIMHVLSDDAFDGRRTLVTVAELIQRGDEILAATLRAVVPPDEKIDPPHLLLFKDMQRNRAFGGRVAGVGSQFRTMLENSAKQFQGVLQSATSNTEFIDSPGMARVLSGTGRTLQLSDLKTDPRGVTLFLSLPMRQLQNTHFRWLRMMLDLITTQMEITRGKPATGHPLLMLLDEFAALHRMDVLQKAAPYIAGFGMKLCFVVQTFKQLHEVYKEAWETFLANAGLKVLFSIEDNFTQEYVSKNIGDTEIIREVHSVNKSESESESEAEGHTHTDTSSFSVTRGKSWSFADSLSSSRARGISRSRSQSRSRSRSTGENWSATESENESVGQSESWGENESSGWSGSASSGPGFNNSSSSRGRSGSRGTSYNYGRSSSSGRGRSSSVGGSQGFTDGTTDGTTDGDSLTNTEGRSKTRTEGGSYAQTNGSSTADGTSETHTKSKSRTEGSGRSQQILKRPLIQPDEVKRIFGRIDDTRDDFYPGLALVMVAGKDPFIVRRANYFHDPLFIDCFSPHPDHAFTRAIPTSAIDGAELRAELEAADIPHIAMMRWPLLPGQLAMPGAVAISIDGLPSPINSARVFLPCFGKVVVGERIDEHPLEKGHYAIPDGDLITVRNYPWVKQDFGIDPFSEIRALPRRKRLEPAIALPPVRKMPRARHPLKKKIQACAIGLSGFALTLGGMGSFMAFVAVPNSWPDYVSVPLTLAGMFSGIILTIFLVSRVTPRVPNKR